jgi:hypothetical protein
MRASFALLRADRQRRVAARRCWAPRDIHISRCQTANASHCPLKLARGRRVLPRFREGKPIPFPRTTGSGAPRRRGCLRGTLAAVASGTPRRLRGASRPLAIGDARLSALCRGDFGPPGPRFRLRHSPPERVQRCSSRPGPSVRRAVPVPSGTAIASRSRGTPLPAPSMDRLRKTLVESAEIGFNAILEIYCQRKIFFSLHRALSPVSPEDRAMLRVCQAIV